MKEQQTSAAFYAIESIEKTGNSVCFYSALPNARSSCILVIYTQCLSTEFLLEGKSLKVDLQMYFSSVMFYLFSLLFV